MFLAKNEKTKAAQQAAAIWRKRKQRKLVAAYHQSRHRAFAIIRHQRTAK